MINIFAESPKLKQRLSIGAKGLGVAVALTTVLGFFVIPAVAKRIAVTQLTEQLGRKVTIETIKLNPFALSLAVEGFRIFEPDGVTPFVQFRRLYVNAQVSSVFRLAPVVKQVSLESLRVNVVRMKATAADLADLGEYNFSDIVARFAATTPAPPTPPDPSATPPKFSINNIGLVDAQITFDDRPQHKVHTITDLNVGIPFVSNLPVYVENLVEPGLTVVIDGAPFIIKGKAKPFKDTLETLVQLKVDDFDLTKILGYVPVKLAFDVASARLDLDLEASFVRTATPSLSVKGRVAVEQLSLKQTGTSAPVVAFDVFELLLGEADLTAMAFDVKAIRLSGLNVVVRRDSAGRLNLLDLLAPSDASAAPDPATKSALPKVDIASVQIEKAHVQFSDATVSPAFQMDIDPIDVGLFDVSTTPGKRGRMQASFASSVGLVFRNNGTFTVEPLSLEGTALLETVLPARFAPYFQDSVNFEIAQGTLRLGTGYSLTLRNAPEVTLSKAFFEARDLSLKKRKAQTKDAFFSVKNFAVADVDINPQTAELSIGSVTSQGLVVKAERGRDGAVDLASLMAAPAAPAAPASAAAPSPSPAWKVALHRLDIAGWSVRMQDRMVNPPATLALELTQATANKLTNSKGPRGDFDLRLLINKRGRLSVSGQAGLDPVDVNAKLDLATLELVPLAPYFSEHVNLTLTDGAVSIKGAVSFQSTASGARAGFRGDINVADVATVQGPEAQRLTGWKRLSLGKLHVDFDEGAPQPLRVAVNEIALSDFFAQVTVAADGKMNVQNLQTTTASTKAAPAAAAQKESGQAQAKAHAPPVPVSVDHVVFSNGHIRYDDQTVKPAYFTEITQLAGRITGLSSKEDTRADVAISGHIDRSGRLSIAGATNPLAKTLFLDLKVDVNEVELPPASPFAGKFVGYNIAKGKLGLSLNYKIEKNQLKATNHLVLDQFTFGETVSSPDAVNLPVRFAVALLKDRHGVIDLDVPIAGSLDDPEFKVGAAVLKVLANLVVKAATAPFSLIASAFEGDDESAFITFAPGSSALDAKARTKLSALAKALQNRPGLSFELQGSSDAAREAEVLKRAFMERKFKGLKLDDLVKGGASVRSPDDVAVSAAERPSLVERVYKSEPFAKPKTVFGAVKPLPLAQMEAAIASHIVVNENDLNELATKRAAAVKEAIVTQAPDVAARLFLVIPVAGKTGGKVEFRFKQD